MWLITTLVCALIATAVYFVLEQRKLGKKYRIHYLALMFWGATLMIFVDHLIGYMEEGGSFIEIETDGLVPNATLLGILMALPVLCVWLGAIGVEKVRENRR
ncbi:MAG: hypothetical protein ACPL1Y_00355 [Thermoplasmata archaeon]